MPELKDIGGGFKVVDGGSQPGLLETAQKQLGLIDLVNRIQAAPLEHEIKRNELILKQEAVKNAPLEAEIKQLQRNEEILDNQVKKIELDLKHVNAIAETFSYDFNTGANAVKRMGGEALDLKDGTALIWFPGQKPILKKIGKITNPEKIRQMEDKAQATWRELVEPYGEIYFNYNSIKEQLALGTKDGDITAIYAKAKMMDPSGRVTDGDVKSVTENKSIPTYLKNQLIAAMSQDGPFFGELGSKTRMNFEESAHKLWEQRRRLVEPMAKSFIEYTVIGEGLNLGKVVVPVGGDMTPENLGFSLKKPESSEEEPASTAPSSRSPQVQPSNTAAKPGPSRPLQDPKEEQVKKFQGLQMNLYKMLTQPPVRK